MIMVIANVSIILFDYHQRCHTYQDGGDDGYDDHEGDLDDDSDCLDANVSQILFNFHQHWHTHHGDGYDHDDDLDDANCLHDDE